MDRRAFFKLSIGGIAATAAVRTWPFRVYSFPKEIAIAMTPGIEPSIVNANMMGGAFEWIMLSPGEGYWDVAGNLIVKNESPKFQAYRIPLPVYARPGILDKLIAREYGWERTDA